jgi:hypothetical protein
VTRTPFVCAAPGKTKLFEGKFIMQTHFTTPRLLAASRGMKSKTLAVSKDILALRTHHIRPRRARLDKSREHGKPVCSAGN